MFILLSTIIVKAHLLTQTSTILLEGLKDSANQSAWSEFDRRYRPLILAAAQRMGLNAEDAQDAAQETLAAFLEAYRQDKYSRQAGRLRDFLRGIAIHKVRDIQRRRGRQEKSISDKTDEANWLSQLPDDQARQTWDEEWSKAVLRRCLAEVRPEVSPQQYEAFELFALYQWPAGKVAGQLGISVDSVYQSKHRVLERIRQILPKIEEIW